MAANSDGVSFYFFDVDDNIMFLPTQIFLLNTATGLPEAITTGDFALIHPVLGRPGKWENYSMFDGSYDNFRDIPDNELEPGQKQHFVNDIKKAVEAGDHSWQGPSWQLFAHACEEQRPISIITARGHSSETLKAGLRVLAEKRLISKEPNYLAIFPVGNDDVRRDRLGDSDLKKTTPALKRIAIRESVKKALEQFGSNSEHRFGMSDDDPQNVSLITRAMCECKREYPDKRFFVINTHLGEMVKLEVFPIDFPVTRKSVSGSAEPLG